ncbi:hypothetical protein BH10CHL1_BH10CHL1_26610 [soil metagenome]
MTNQVRERRHDTGVNDREGMHTDVVDTYQSPSSVSGSGPVTGDRVRWGAILAGLFAALTTLVVMSVLGLAIGLSSYDAGDPLGNFGLGAGIWGIISALLAFLIGGWVAASTAGARGRGNGILNGSMVWVVAIPLILYMLGSGLGSLLGTAGNVAATGVSAVAPAAAAAAPAAGTAAAQTPGAQATVQEAGQGAVDAVQATASALGDQVNPQNAERVASAAGKTAWGTLAGLVVGLIASAIGGLLGARPVRREAIVTA